jgi:glycosyltransferase involved in cell wall biosynthesis
MKISATVITLNEERNIEAALRSLEWADEIVVVDCESTDSTIEIARRFTDRIHVRKWPGYSAQKSFAAEQASHDWVFNLDADERVSDRLSEEIQQLKAGRNPNHAAFEMPRRAFYLGRWIKHCGWYPDYKIRLYDRKVGGWRGDFVHESVQTSGKVGRLTGEILHYTIRSASEHQLRMDRYTTLAAEEMFARGKRASAMQILVSPIATFVKSYFFRLGFLDGIPGLAISYFAGHYAFLRTLKLWEMRRKGSDE